MRGSNCAYGTKLSSIGDAGRIVLYGVGSRSSNFINIMGVASLVNFAIDDQPQKQNRFMPLLSIPILSTAEASP